MRVLWRLLLVAAIFLNTHGGVAQVKAKTSGSSPDFSLHIGPPRQVVKAGSPVQIEVNVVNATDHKIWFSAAKGGKGWSELTYNVTIRDAQGSSPPLTKLGRALTGEFLRSDDEVPNSVDHVFADLETGESAPDVMTVSKIYDLSRPGSYVVTISGADTKDAWVYSNTVSIKVIP
jgi:hypothetical protein